MAKKADAPDPRQQVPKTTEPQTIAAAPLGVMNVDRVLVEEPDGSQYLMDPRRVKELRPHATILRYADGRTFVRSEVAGMPDLLDDSDGTPDDVDPKTGLQMEQHNGDQDESANQGGSNPPGAEAS